MSGPREPVDAPVDHAKPRREEVSRPGEASVAGRLANLQGPGAISLAALPPLSLYVHLPWCIRKCPYCDFNSHAIRGRGKDDLPQQRYVEALVADLDAALPFVWGRRVHTVFIGGGTPSLFAPAQ
ncbi:MAG TPA: radical SAM protein, partial [Caldimonas sp.]|nr:radical SAM protein [Caldimonas sp.]